MKCFLVISLLCLFYNQGESYRASVFEHFPATEEEAETTIKKNLEFYRKYIANSHNSKNNLDIVVFPEYGLTSLEYSPLEDYAIDVENNTYNIITEVADMAKENNVYIVINLLEKEQRSNRKTKYYNTDLVFSRNGSIIAKYRKINLFKEDQLSRGDEIVTFTTDFGVTFGIFNSFDIFFEKPSRDILKNVDVTDIIYPTSWKSMMPFYTSLGIQHGYVLASGVNLLAASYDHPKKGYGGSSIIKSNGKVSDSYIGFVSSSKPIVEEVEQHNTRRDTTICPNFAPQGLPIDPSQKPTIADFVTDRFFKSSEYTLQKIDLSQRDISKQICHKDFCCNFNITITEPNTNEIYKLVAYDGEESLGDVSRYVRICSLVACDSDDNCGSRLNGTTKFKIRLESNFKKNNSTFYSPITLLHDLTPVDSAIYCEQSKDNGSFVQLYTPKSQQKIIVFGIYGSEKSFALRNSGMVFLVLAAAVKFVFL